MLLWWMIEVVQLDLGKIDTLVITAKICIYRVVRSNLFMIYVNVITEWLKFAFPNLFKIIYQWI